MTTSNQLLEFANESQEIFNKLNREKLKYRSKFIDSLKVINMCYGLFRILDLELDNIENDDLTTIVYIKNLVESGRLQCSNYIEELF
jgi:hypothetical protein